MKISIVTINYNSSENTINLLESLKNQTDSDFEIIIIDNASEEPFTKGIFAKMPFAKMPFVIKSSENLGFSGGNNIGIRQALGWNNDSNPVKSPQVNNNGASWVVLLNNDTWVEKDFIGHLRAVLKDSWGIAGFPLDEEGKIAYYGQIQWLKPTLEHVYSIKNQALRRGTNHPTLNTKYLILNTGRYAIGGALAIHKDVFNKIGFLDEKYFLYFEDADFSIMARKANFQISIAENILIHHRVSSTTKKLGSPLLLRYHYRNALYFNLKNGPWYVKLMVWPWSWIIIARQLIKIAFNYNREQSVSILNGVVDFYKHRMNKIK